MSTPKTSRRRESDVNWEAHVDSEITDMRSEMAGVSAVVNSMRSEFKDLKDSIQSIGKSQADNNKPQYGVVLTLCALIFTVGASLFGVMSSTDNRLEASILRLVDTMEKHRELQPSQIREFTQHNKDDSIRIIKQVDKNSKLLFDHVSDGHPEVQKAEILNLRKRIDILDDTVVNKDYLELSREASANRLEELEAEMHATEEWKREHDFRVGGINGVQDERDRLFEIRLKKDEDRVNKIEETFHMLFAKVYQRFDMFHVRQKREVTTKDDM